MLTIILKKKCSAMVEVIGTSTSATEGKQLIETLKPDLVFLDIEMPGMTGVDLVRSFDNPAFEVVFVTAFDAFAIDAFRLSTVDYLLKPVESEDVIRAVQKIQSALLSRENPFANRLKQLESLLLERSVIRDSKLGIAMADKIVFINISDIIYCEASGAYTVVWMAGGDKIVASCLLGDFEIQLSAHRFFRIHHHHLINLNRIKEFQRNDGVMW